VTVELPSGLRRDLEGKKGHALLLTRNNAALAGRLEREFPGITWTVLTKDTVRGWGPRRLVGALRRSPWRIVLIEDNAEDMRRRRDLYRLLILAGRGKSRWLVGSGPESLEVERVRPGEGLFQVPASLVAEAWACLRAVSAALRLTRSLDRSGPPPPRARAPGRRVAMLKTQFWFGVRAGGSVSHVLGVARGMKALGLEPRLWTTSPLPVSRTELVQTAIAPARRPSIFEEAAMAGFNRTFVERAGGELAAFRPAVVYHRHDVFNLAGLALARMLGVPLVLEVNASEVWARAAWSRLFLRRLAEKMERTAFRNADRLVLISEELVPTVIALGGSADRIVVNPNGVEIERFDPARSGDEVRSRLGIPSDAVVCGFLGTFTRWHGVAFLAGRVPGLVAADPRLRFLFVGDGDLKPEVEQRLLAGGAKDRVTFTGLVPPIEVPGLLAACDILLSPHLPFEDGTEFFGSPTKLFEYMAAGRAIVASRLGPIGRLIEDGETGVLFPPGDGEAFDRAVAELARDPAARGRLGRKARERAEANYTWTANARRALDGLIDLSGTPSGRDA
jgi:glycosyltransferase involved in cell wall biosynthesis